MRVLAIDTALGACQAAAIDGGRVLAARSEAMARGHQERLAPLVAELMAELSPAPPPAVSTLGPGAPPLADDPSGSTLPSPPARPPGRAPGKRNEEDGLAAAFATLDRVAVTVGPGSFTGLRVGLAFAKGLGLALDRPVIGVGTLAALAASAEAAGVSVALIDAGRGRVHLQAFDSGAPLGAPQTLAMDEAAAQLAVLAPRRLVGPGAPLLASAVDAELVALDAPDPVAVGRLAATSAPEAAPPRPLYLRAPDAKTLAERRAAAALA